MLGTAIYIFLSYGYLLRLSYGHAPPSPMLPGKERFYCTVYVPIYIMTGKCDEQHCAIVILHDCET